MQGQHQNVTSACFGARKIDFTTAPDAKPDALDQQRSRMPLGKPFERGSVPRKTESTFNVPIDLPKRGIFRTQRGKLITSLFLVCPCLELTWLHGSCLELLLGVQFPQFNFLLLVQHSGCTCNGLANTCAERRVEKKFHTFWQLGSATSLLGL